MMTSTDTHRPNLVIGVDVGGTNTDSVLLDTTKSGTDAVISWNKTATASNVTVGVKKSLESLLQSGPGIAKNVAAVTVGTTHFLNAIVEHDASRLEKVAVIRLASYNFTGQTPPFVDWPSGLRSLLEGHAAFVPGGVNIDGTKIADLDSAAVLEQAEIIKQKGISSVAIVGVGSPMDTNYKQEDEVRTILKQKLGEGVDIVCSHDIAGPGILARENASILNASIVKFARRTIRNFLRAMLSLGLKCPLYLTSNTGHLLSFAEAREFPIRIFSSGATNSIRGAAYLAGNQLPRDGAVVVDIGGTTTDVGSILQNGYPRLASSWTQIAGVKVNLEVLQVDSMGLGGGSVIHETENGKIIVGPDSVGHELIARARCFAGDVPTATDIAVTQGAKIGTADPRLSPAIIAKGQERIKVMLENLIDRVKNSTDSCTLVLVGGGSVICPSQLEGVHTITVPEYAGVANAIGAAIAQVSGKAEKRVDVYHVEATREEMKAQAIADAKSHGGIAEAALVIKDAVVGVPYVDHLKNVSVEVACPADHSKFYQYFSQETSSTNLEEEPEGDDDSKVKQHASAKEQDDVETDITSYRPSVDSSGVWSLSTR
ncbi:Vacuolar protein sorting-associated protein 53 [Ascosphaera pollenicola]|nr:Vacuolar protein sorting-associated protein 53 [Ascosphaera pollenicola]